MGGGLGHAPGVARGADPTAFAGEGDQEVVAALIAPRPREAVGQDAAFQEATPRALGMGRKAFRFPSVMAQGDEGLQVMRHHPVERGVRGAAGLIGSGAAFGQAR